MSRDPLEELFEAIDPLRDVDDATLFTPGRLLERLHGEIDPRRPRRRFWHRGTVVSLIGLTVLTGTAAAVTLWHTPVRNVASVTCYQKISLTSNADIISYTTHPLVACGSVWHWTSLPSGPAPNGTLCVLSSGSLAAFPPSRRGDACERLRLPVFSGRVKSSAVARFQTTTISYFASHKCVSPILALHEVRQLIDRFNLRRWRARNTGSLDRRSCVFPAFQISTRVVDLVGSPIIRTGGP
jgi:hypothetical protein